MTIITLSTERLRKDLAHIWRVAPFRVEIDMSAPGRLSITVDGAPMSQEQLDAFERRAKKVAAEIRSRLN
jgi:hypothetical protein